MSSQACARLYPNGSNLRLADKYSQATCQSKTPTVND
jgi:hypothetical protein